MADKIAHKIGNVDDSVCMQCFQLWKGECRAFEMPHDVFELVHRRRGGALCTSIDKQLMLDSDISIPGTRNGRPI